jgi:hypothetical protein
VRIEGDQGDYFLRVYADSAGVYAMGYSLSSFSSGSSDIIQMKVSHDGDTTSYLKSFGGNNAEVGTDIAIYGSYEYICGFSISESANQGTDTYGLTRGLYDVVVLKLTKSSMSYKWGKFMGYPDSNEYSLGCTTDDEGNLYGTAATDTT